MAGRILVAAPKYQSFLEAELQHRALTYEQLHDGLFRCLDQDTALVWPVCEWQSLEQLEFASIGEAAKQLRARGPYWDHLAIDHARRSQLIQDKLLKLKQRPFTFPYDKTLKARGAFCLLDKHQLLAASHCTRPFIDGQFPFEQDRENPPARAYLKIWEAFSLLQDHPQPNERVLELGAAPGAWTWCLAGLGAEVYSLDRAALDPRIEALANVHHYQGDAFSSELHQETWDWICSDLICYPERLIELIHDCLQKNSKQKMIITIKFQGPTDFNAVDALQQIPNSWLIHLYHNKNEVCFIHHPRISALLMGAWAT